MASLLVLRERLRKFYARFGGWIIRILRFAVAFTAFAVTGNAIGYMTALRPLWISLVLAVVCAFLPNGFMVAVLAFVVLAHMYAVSLEVMLVVAAVLFIFFCLYYVFQPGDCIILAIMPLLCVMHIPAVMPLVLGMVGSVFGILPMSFGIIIYYMLRYVRDNVSVLASTGSLTAMGRYTQIIDGLLGNREMWLVIVVFALTFLTVYLIGKLSAKHAWTVAVVAGACVNVLFMFAGAMVADVSMSAVEVIVSGAAALAAGFVTLFFRRYLDYSHTERLQFEDDDYYYYVKAVPKVAMTEPELTRIKINAQEDKQTDEELFQPQMDFDVTREIFDTVDKTEQENDSDV